MSKTSLVPGITGQVNHDDLLFSLPGFLQPYKPMLMSYSSSLASTTIGYPFDSMKTRMQTYKFTSAFDCFSQTIKTEGFKGLFRGISAPLVSTSFSKSMGVTLYMSFKPEVALAMGRIYTPYKVDEKASKLRKTAGLALANAPISIVSGSLAGGCVSLFACPFEFTKLFLQISILAGKNQPHVPMSVVQVGRQIIKTEGVRGLYSGFKYHIIRDAVSSGLFFAIYETFKFSFQMFSTEDGYIQGTSIPCGPTSVAMAGAVSGVFSWISVFPIDTVKSLIQRDIVSNILRVQSNQEKLPLPERKMTFPTRRMYRGLGPSITRSVIATMTFFSVFEYLMTHIE